METSFVFPLVETLLYIIGYFINLWNSFLSKKKISVLNFHFHIKKSWTIQLSDWQLWESFILIDWEKVKFALVPCLNLLLLIYSSHSSKFNLESQFYDFSSLDQLMVLEVENYDLEGGWNNCKQLDSRQLLCILINWMKRIKRDVIVALWTKERKQDPMHVRAVYNKNVLSEVLERTFIKENTALDLLSQGI